MTQAREATSGTIATEFCSTCPVLKGECPKCGTFWVNDGSGKRYGVRRVDANPIITAGGDTRHPGWLNHLMNVVER